ncbi:MAG: hypothetical protein VX938_07055, partial [Myxococcota bacterium]|nr:hypothetical protein [Myxococcota bacterium]
MLRQAPLSYVVVTALIAALAISGPGCTAPEQTAQPTQQPTTAPPTTPTPTPTPTPTDTGLNLTGALYFTQPTGDDGTQCISLCTVKLQGGGTANLGVRLLNATGQPISSAGLSYVLTGTPGVVQLSSISTYTDLLGQAAVSASAIGGQGAVTVTVSVPGSPMIDPISFNVSVEVPDVPLLQVSYQYAGSTPNPTFDVEVYGPTNAPTCAQVHPDSALPGLNPAAVAGPLAAGNVAIFDTLPSAANGAQASWTIQVLSPTGGPYNARGCITGIMTTEGETRDVTVQVGDMPLRYSGIYELTTTMDLMSGLSGSGAGAITNLIDLFSEPGKVVVLLACGSAGGTLGTLCDILVDGDELSSAGAFVADAANDLFLDLMENVLGEQVMDAGQALGDMLRNVTFFSSLSLSTEPTSLAPGTSLQVVAGAPAQEVWHTVQFVWETSNGCTGGGGNCVVVDADLGEIYGIPPAEALEVGLDPLNGLHISIHPVEDLTYGLLIDSLLEQGILPLLFGDGTETIQTPQGETINLPPVDSWEDLASILLGNKECLAYDNCCDVLAY